MNLKEIVGLIFFINGIAVVYHLTTDTSFVIGMINIFIGLALMIFGTKDES